MYTDVLSVSLFNVVALGTWQENSLKLFFSEMEHAASSIGASASCPDGLSSANKNLPADVFDAFKQGLIKNVIQGLGLLSFRQKNSSKEEDSPLTETVSFPEHIEMCHFQRREPAKGHNFQPLQLLNPTWCDECAEFIWGVYKQCLRCKNCQLTCHHKCRPLVTLDCKSVSQDLADNVDEGMELFADEEQTRQSDLSSTSSPSTELASEPSTEKDETDSGYRSGTIPEEKLPPKPSQATLNREELKKRITEYNKKVPGANFALKDHSGEAFQGFLKVTLNLVRPINMSLGARPPSIYEILTREHIVEQDTQNISFYMPRDTVKSIHVLSNATTKEVITALLKKFNILDHPRKFAMYEQELVNNKIAKLRRVGDKECPLHVCLSWDPENLSNHRLVLQENETGEIVWDAFSFPELCNFMKVLDREQEECTNQLIYKYKVMRRIILQRMKELRKEQEQQKRKSTVLGEASVT